MGQTSQPDIQLCSYCRTPSRLELEGVFYVVACDGCPDVHDLVGEPTEFEKAYHLWTTGKPLKRKQK